MGVEETSPDWAIRVEINSKGNIATVTAYQKKLLPTTSSDSLDNDKSSDPQTNNTNHSDQISSSNIG